MFVLARPELDANKSLLGDVKLPAKIDKLVPCRTEPTTRAGPRCAAGRWTGSRCAPDSIPQLKAAGFTIPLNS